MAKARHVPGLSGETTYALAAARVISVRAAEMSEHAANVLDLSDIERVHDMRVATRRLRAALEAFRACFPKPEFKLVLAEVKAIADALGERRDRDVAMAALSQYMAVARGPEHIGARSLLATIEAERREANDELAALVTERRLEVLSESLAGLVFAAEQRSPGTVS